MAVEFREATYGPLVQVSATAPDGSVIGLVGDAEAGQSALLQLAAGLAEPVSGSVAASGAARYVGPQDPLNLAPVPVLCLDQSLSLRDRITRGRALVTIEALRRAGTVILLASHDLDLLRATCDEVWWLVEGQLVGQGDPGEVVRQYERDVAVRLREWADGLRMPLAPSLRKGDGRGRVTGLELQGANGGPTAGVRSGEEASVVVSVRYESDVADPVVGMMIRTRVGFEVYGTNTELEGLELGPVKAGESRCVRFRFGCELCPNEYTLTVASHDRDGVWHDWLEDALAFSVSDGRYTAGVANLRARVTAE